MSVARTRGGSEAGVLKRAARAGYDAAAPALGLVVGSALHLARDGGRVALTFDDGPDPHWTPALLQVLRAHDASATFFMLGTSVRRHPDIARHVAAAGGEVALHGLDHRRTTRLGAREFDRSIRAGRRVVEEATGATVRWYRPPYGAQNPTTWALTRRAGLTPVMWDATFWDWRVLPQEERVAKALSTARAGSIMLAHDRHAGPQDGCDDGPDPNLDRVDLLDQVLTGLARQGLRATSVGEALAGGALLRRRLWFAG